MTTLPLQKKQPLIFLLAFLIMEIPIRIMLQPDPWLLHSTHWYFLQPMRLLIEVGLVTTLFSIIWTTERPLLAVPKQHLQLLVLSVFISAGLFSTLEYDQLIASLQTPLANILLWAVTGFCIGLGQECLYRGLLFGALQKSLNIAAARWGTTVIFILAPLHSERLFEYVVQGEYVVVMLLVAIYAGVSVFFQYLREKTHSVIVPGLVHGVGNAITWLAVFA